MIHRITRGEWAVVETDDAMTDAAKRVLDAVAEVVRLRRETDRFGDDYALMRQRNAAFRALWIAYGDYEREQPIDHGYSDG